MTDVFVVGGGPAGLAAAIAARMRGMSVVVADCARPPIDKTCGEGLMPDSLEALSELGVELRDAADSHPFRGIRFLGDHAAVDARFPVGEGIGVRRTVLHQLLIDRAHEIGVTMRWGVRVEELEASRARWIIGADGQRSRVRHWAGLEATTRDSRRYGFRRHYRAAPWTDCMEIYWGPDCQMYVTPVSGNQVCVALISRDPLLRMADVEGRFPRLMARLAGAEPVTSERGAVSASRRLRRIWNRNVALIGDASGSVDAITGEGMCLSFRQAGRLAEAMEKEDLAGYQKWHQQAMRRPALMAEVMLLLDRFPAMREGALRALAMRPGIFRALLAVHVRGGDFCLDRFISVLR
ncbi:MAG TPA: FAD-dependent monooxygenase [Bryobacteraceae bacterium]|nr:FAD-dependent monooxygenase [Bryobacteraceae bacterium]